MTQLIASFTIMLFSLPSLAILESAVGNGGIGIVCPDPIDKKLIKSVELLDYLEGIYLYDYTYVELSKTQNIASKIFTRLLDSSPKRAEQYKKWYDSFSTEAAYKSAKQLLDPEDSYHYINRKGCKHKTLILQMKFHIPGTPKYLINKDYVPLMSDLEQNMLMFHELIYREAIEKGHSNSIFTRKYTALLFSDQWDEKKDKALKRLMKIYKFPRDYGDL